MKPFRTLVILIAAASALSACGGRGDDLGTELGLSSPQARFINAIPGGTNLDYYLNGQVNEANVQYRSVTRYRDVEAGSQTAAYSATGTSVAIASQAFDAVKGHHYTTIAVQDSPSPISVIDDPYNKKLLSNKARVRGFNASSNTPNVDIYVVAPGTNISNETPAISSVAYQSAAPASGEDSLYLPGGTYRIIVTDAGSKSPIFRSEPISLANNEDWLILTVPSGGRGSIAGMLADQIHVLIAQGNGAVTPAKELTNDTGAPVPPQTPPQQQQQQPQTTQGTTNTEPQVGQNDNDATT